MRVVEKPELLLQPGDANGNAVTYVDDAGNVQATRGRTKDE